MKKFRIFLASLITAFVIAVLPSENLISSVTFASAESAEVISGEQNQNEEEYSEDDSPSKTVSALLIIGLFTVTFAVSGVFTYKIRRKNSLPDQDKS